MKGNYIFQSLPAAQVLQVLCRKIRSWSAPTIIPVMKNEAVLSDQGCVCVGGGESMTHKAQLPKMVRTCRSFSFTFSGF